MLRANTWLLLPVLALLGAGSDPDLHGLESQSFTFAIAGDFSAGSHATAVASLWEARQPTLSLGLGDYSYANSPPSNWCTAIWNLAVGNRDGFLAIGDHDTYYGDRLTNDSAFGYWEGATGYANSCGVKGSGVDWTGSGSVSNNRACNTSNVLSLFDTCFGREMYVDYPQVSPLVRFIVLCDGVLSNPNATAWCNYGPSGADASRHFAWLDRTVGEAHDRAIPWIVVLNHQHYWSAGPYGINYSADLWNHLIADGVDIFITGNLHNYQRSYPLVCPTTSHDWYQNKNGPLVPGCIGNTSRGSYVHGEGLVYLITGTGGQDLDRFNASSVSWLSNMGYTASLNDTSWGFSLFSVTSMRISASFVSAIGSFTDSWSISYNGPIGGRILGTDSSQLIVAYTITAVLGATAAAVVLHGRRKRWS